MLVSLLNGECVLYDAVAIVLFTSLKKHIDEASPAFLTMDILRLFVLVFFGSFAFGVIPGAWSPGVSTNRVSQSVQRLRDRRYVSLRISHVFGVSAVAVLHGRQFPETVQRPISCTTSPVLQAVQFPRWFAVLDTLTTCPLLVTTGVWSWTVSYCRVSAVAVLWWSVPSPSLQVQVPMVLTVQMNNVADVLVMHIV